MFAISSIGMLPISGLLTLGLRVESSLAVAQRKIEALNILQ